MASSLLSERRVRLSRFVVTYRDVTPGEHVLYDVAGDRYAGVDDAMLGAIARWGSADPADAGEREAQAALAGLDLLVKDEAGDAARLAASFRRAADGMPGTLYVTWMPTLACNLACDYCFQKDHPATGHMSAETEAATLAWILRQVEAAGTPRLTVHYIGGEPLTRKDLVRRTARALSAEMARRGGTFEWELTTNGIGLEPGFVNELLALGPGLVKVTIDGDRETHDGARVWRSGKGTFDDVFAATVAVAKGCPGLKLRVGGNFHPGQEASYERLLGRMEAAGLRGLLHQVRFKPIVETGSGCSGCATAPGEADTLVQIGRSVTRRGLAREPLTEVDATTPCELHWTNAWVIDPEGRLYKCLDVAGRPEMALGSVREGVVRPDPLTAGSPWDRNPDCHTCAFLPVCAGGCLGGRYLQTGLTGEVMCRKEHFEKTFREEIVRRYLAEFHPQDEAKKEAA